MRRAQLEHIIRASGAITEDSEIIVIGSQAILATDPEPAPELQSIEADVCPLNRPELSDLIDGSIGELSRFHETFGYYGHGLGPEAAVLPKSWRSRLVRLQNENTNNVIGYCLSPIDLAYSKLAAGRPKDLEFAGALLKYQYVTKEQILQVAAEGPTRLPEGQNECGLAELLAERIIIAERNAKRAGTVSSSDEFLERVRSTREDDPDQPPSRNRGVKL